MSGKADVLLFTFCAGYKVHDIGGFTGKGVTDVVNSFVRWVC